MQPRDNSLNEFDIQNALFSRLFTAHIHICPNYSPRGWFECDMFAVTKSGLFVEFEIKISAADFREDAKKTRYKHILGDAKEGKHDLLKTGCDRGPSRFFYVLPEGVVQTVDVPEWAGIIRVSRSGERVDLVTERKAPHLHKKMVDPSVIHHVQKVFFYRFWNERRRKRGGKITNEVKPIRDPEP